MIPTAIETVKQTFLKATFLLEKMRMQVLERPLRVGE